MRSDRFLAGLQAHGSKRSFQLIRSDGFVLIGVENVKCCIDFGGLKIRQIAHDAEICGAHAAQDRAVVCMQDGTSSPSRAIIVCTPTWSPGQLNDHWCHHHEDNHENDDGQSGPCRRTHAVSSPVQQRCLLNRGNTTATEKIHPVPEPHRRRQRRDDFHAEGTPEAVLTAQMNGKRNRCTQDNGPEQPHLQIHPGNDVPAVNDDSTTKKVQ
mmetsp:Transcript_6454/g.15842  ORF Transcript_6454/g.15842 Transcript_6454/m.15842 type:complete len:211 (-) Transcript_6454:379-1011(-)